MKKKIFGEVFEKRVTYAMIVFLYNYKNLKTNYLENLTFSYTVRDVPTYKLIYYLNS